MAEDLHPTPAEQKLIDAAAKGETADYRVGDKQADDPANGADWGEDRTLRAEILYDLCTGARPEWKLRAKGIRAVGARITGLLDFQGAEVNAPLILAVCPPGSCARPATSCDRPPARTRPTLKLARALWAR